MEGMAIGVTEGRTTGLGVVEVVVVVIVVVGRGKVMGMLEVEMGISAGKRKVETSGRDVKFEASVEEREDVDEGSGLVILVALVLCDMLGTKE